MLVWCILWKSYFSFFIITFRNPNFDVIVMKLIMKKYLHFVVSYFISLSPRLRFWIPLYILLFYFYFYFKQRYLCFVFDITTCLFCFYFDINSKFWFFSFFENTKLNRCDFYVIYIIYIHRFNDVYCIKSRM